MPSQAKLSFSRLRQIIDAGGATHFLVLFGLISTSLWFSSCGGKPSSTVSTKVDYPTIDLTHYQDTAYLSSFVDSISYLPLATPGEGMINEVDQLVITDDRLWIVDENQTKVWVYDKAGTFLFQIGTRGRGPGELAGISDLIVVPSKKQIFLSGAYRAMQQFDWDGNLQREWKATYYFQEAALLNDSTYALFTMVDNSYTVEEDIDLAYNLLLTNGNITQVKGKAAPYLQGVDNMLVHNRLSQEGDQLLFNYSYWDTIYQVTPTGITPAYCLEFGKHRFSQDILSSLPRPFEQHNVHQEIRKLGVHSTIGRMFHTQDYLFAYTSVSSRTRIIVYHRPSGFTLYSNFLINDLTETFSIHLKEAHGRNLYYVLYPSELVEQDHPQAQKLLKQVGGEDAPPILMICHLKELPLV